jgi:hypothetical protein
VRRRRPSSNGKSSSGKNKLKRVTMNLESALVVIVESTPIAIVVVLGPPEVRSEAQPEARAQGCSLHRPGGPPLQRGNLRGHLSLRGHLRGFHLHRLTGLAEEGLGLGLDLGAERGLDLGAMKSLSMRPGLQPL